MVPDAHISRARSAALSGKIIEAIHGFGDAIESAPDNTAFKTEFIQYLQGKNLRIISTRLRSVITLCLADPQVSCHKFGITWHSLMMNDPAFKPFPKLLRIGNYASFKKHLQKNEKAGFLSDPYFLYGLCRVTVPLWTFERFLTFLRRYLLEFRTVTLLDGNLPYALARYCRTTGYIFRTSEEERTELKTLDPARLADRILLACYLPAGEYDVPDDVDPRWREFIEEERQRHTRLEAEKNNVAALTAIENAVSNEVRAQYETYPYPVWDRATAYLGNSTQEEPLKGRKLSMLVAGCGTGQEAVSLALQYPDADILAIDLSRTSLAYAQMKARQHGVANLSFGQADILKLESLNRTFDFITSSGVLHHMEDPLAGWSMLEKILKPGGLMRICLYSKPSRWAINEARDIIAKKGFSNDDAGIHAFRDNAEKLLSRRSYKKIITYFDYYYKNEVRDLLFHVQEHQFNIPAIADDLNRLNLDFEGFLPPSGHKSLFAKPPMVSYKKKYPDDPDAKNLRNWDAFERKNPDTFQEMYRFYCRKRN